MKWIITSTLCAAFLVNSIFFGWEATRRSGVEEAQIQASKTAATSSMEKNCIAGGGMPDYYEGVFLDCKKNN